MRAHAICAIPVLVPLPGFAVVASDWPQWGGGPTRNAVSPEKNPPTDFRLPEFKGGKDTIPGHNVAWTAELGNRTVVPPVIAGGLVWVCTSARQPVDEKIPEKEWDGGVLMCFRESDGKFLWKHRSPRLSGKGVDRSEDFSDSALGSCPLVEGDRLWYVNNRSEVVCFDIEPLKKGSGNPIEVWKLDMRKELGVFPRLPLMQFGFGASVGGYKDKLYVVTHNAADYNRVPAPDAPSLLCLEKATGKLVWKDNSPGKNILGIQISSPLVAEIDGKPQVLVGQGDGWLRSFDAANGKLIWKCDLNTKDAVWEEGGTGDRKYIIATPMLYKNRVYASKALELAIGGGEGGLYCVDATKQGDVSRELDAGPKKGKPNPNSAVVWYTPREIPADAPRIEVGVKKKRDLLRLRDFYFGETIASVTVHEGLVYAAELSGWLFCFDAESGKLYWVEDLKTGLLSQPLVVDRKVYISTYGSDIYVFAHGKERKQLARIETNQDVRPGLVFANGTLYVTEQSRLSAIRSPK